MNNQGSLSELDSVGMTAFIECVRGCKYGPAQGSLAAFVTPSMESAMYRRMRVWDDVRGEMKGRQAERSWSSQQKITTAGHTEGCDFCI